MLMRKTLACLLIPTLLTIANTSKANALSTDVEEKVELINIKNGYDKLQEGIQRRKEIEEKVNKRIDNIIARQEKEEQERIERENSYDIEFLLTYYSRHPSENGGYNCTAYGEALREGIVANNMYPKGTKILLEDGREYVVADKGGNSYFNNYYHLDVFVDTYDRDKVLKMGKQNIKGKVVLP